MTAVDRTPGPHPQPPTSTPTPTPEPAPGASRLPGLPRLPGGLVPRTHLSRRLDRLAAITVVDALPGFGGRTLVAAWAREQHAAGRHVVWLDGIADEKPAAFRDRLRAALVTAGALPDDTGPDLVGWVPALAACRRPVVIVIAGASWLLTGRSAERLLAVARNAHPVHLVLIDADTQAFVEAARRGGVDVQAIRSSDLTLRPEDVRAFAGAWGHPLDEVAARAVADRVGGWILPLRLALEATPPGSDVLALHVADDYVRDEVLPGLLADDELRAAARLAVPRIIDGPLAEALLTDLAHSGPALVEALERRDLLWRHPTTGGRPRWRLPALVRSALLAHGRTDPDGQRHAHRVTARILACRGEADPVELVEHSRAAGDPALLAELWAEHGWALLGTDLTGFAQAFGHLPDGEHGAEPADDALLVAAALADASRRVPPEADWLTRTETLLRRYASVGERFLAERREATSPSARLDLLTAAMVARRGEGALSDAVRLADELDRAIRARRTAVGRSLAAQASWAWVQAAMTHLHAGRYGEAHRLAMAANDAAPRSVLGRGAAALLGLLATSSGDRAEAERWLALWDAGGDDGSWGARLAGLPARLARAMQAMDRLDPLAAEEHLADSSLSGDASGMLPVAVAAHTRHALLFGEPVAMLARLDHLALLAERQLATPGGLWRQVFDRSSVDLLLALGEVDRARALLGHDATDVPPWLVPSAARFHLITGEPLAAARVARAGAWQGVVHARDRMELLVVSARALHTVGRTGEALEDLRRAHALGGHVGSLEPYLLLGEDRHALLAEAGLALREEERAALDRTPAVYPASATFVRLTPREVVVLTEMGRHETAAAVARSLTVSVNTVKKQMVSIYAKLGVHDRGSALIRAQRLGLLPAPTVTPHPRRR
ncbi:LuxR C-terminal-related transcriptional regulator [Nocardioides sp. BYT-33-1]|uniref:helix-turn-helix transcriptional regulator n=1 Tax=Nocardioides sp. BYT-33-1 TaxID=3416952 RepID=UPI003F52F37C